MKGVFGFFLGMQPDGTALIVWQNVVNETGRILHRRISPAGVLQPIQILAVEATSPGMAVAGTGYAVVAWYKSGVGIQVRARPPTGSFGPFRTLVPAKLSTLPSISMVTPWLSGSDSLAPLMSG